MTCGTTSEVQLEEGVALNHYTALHPPVALHHGSIHLHDQRAPLGTIPTAVLPEQHLDASLAPDWYLHLTPSVAQSNYRRL